MVSSEIQHSTVTSLTYNRPFPFHRGSGLIFILARQRAAAPPEKSERGQFHGQIYLLLTIPLLLTPVRCVRLRRGERGEGMPPLSRPDTFDYYVFHPGDKGGMKINLRTRFRRDRGKPRHQNA